MKTWRYDSKQLCLTKLDLLLAQFVPEKFSWGLKYLTIKSIWSDVAVMFPSHICYSDKFGKGFLWA